MAIEMQRQTAVRKPTISVFGLSSEMARFVEPIKQSLEIITGSRAGMSELKGLSKAASLEEVVAKVNEICARLNASGKC